MHPDQPIHRPIQRDPSRTVSLTPENAESTPKGVLVLTSNVRSLRHKMDEIIQISISKKPDIIAFTETWLSSDISNAEIAIPGYDAWRTDRLADRTGGGVVLYCKALFRVTQIDASASEDGCETIWCKVHDGKRSSILGVIYRSPLSRASDMLRLLRTHGCGRDCLIMGDFNAPEIDWNMLVCRSAAESFGASLLDTIIDCNLIQHVTQPTRLSPQGTDNILDLVLSGTQNDICDLQLHEPIGSSDHCTLTLVWTKCMLQAPALVARRNFYRFDASAMLSAASLMNWNIPTTSNIDEAWIGLKNKLHSLITQFVPFHKTRLSIHRPAWMDKELRTALRRRKRLWNIFRCSRTSQNYELYKRCRNLCTAVKRKKRIDYENRLAEASVLNPKRLYAYIKRSTKDCRGIPTLTNPDDDEPVLDDSNKAELLSQQYASVFTEETPFCNADDVLNITQLDSLCFNPADVRTLLLQIDCNSAPGPDALHPIILKTLADIIAQPVAFLYQLSMDSGRLPVDWKYGEVKPIFKGGARHSPQNYRPICLTPILCKIMEKLIKKALHQHCSTLDLISTSQHGFHPGRSCITNLQLARELWVSAVDAGSRLDVIFVDFSKAFDKVPHERLLYKLQRIGLTGNLLSWIRDFLCDRTLRVKVNDSLSPEIAVTSGVPQGSVLGPELFKLFINDLPATLGVTCLAYADDLKLWTVVTCKERARVLQQALDNLHQWTSQWLLPVNYQKCAVLPVGASEPFSTYTLGGNFLRVVNSERDLGVIVTSDLKSKLDTEKKAAVATRLVGAIRRSFAVLTPHVLRILFCTHVRPVLEYGQPAVYPLTKGEVLILENVQRRATKRVPELRHLSYEQRLKTLNLFSLAYRRRRADLIYARRILSNSCGPELKSFFHLNTSITRGHNMKLFKPRTERLSPKVTLSTRVVNDWNSLPSDVILSTSEACFKKAVDRRFETDCFISP